MSPTDRLADTRIASPDPLPDTPIPERYIEAHTEIRRLADLYKTDKITDARFTVDVGFILSGLWRGEA